MKKRTEWGHHKIWGGDIVLPVLMLEIIAARRSCFIVWFLWFSRCQGEQVTAPCGNIKNTLCWIWTGKLEVYVHESHWTNKATIGKQYVNIHAWRWDCSQTTWDENTSWGHFRFSDRCNSNQCAWSSSIPLRWRPSHNAGQGQLLSSEARKT